MSERQSGVARATWWEYVQECARGATNRAIAEAVGITPSSVGRWRDSRPDPPQAASFARAYGRPVLEAFIAAGFLTPEEAGETPSRPPSLSALKDEELLDEIAQRLRLSRAEMERQAAQQSDTELPPVLAQQGVTLAARRMRSRGKALRAELDALGEESQESGGAV